MVVGSGPGAMGAAAATTLASLVVVGTDLAPEDCVVVGLEGWIDAAPLAAAAVGLDGEEGGGGGDCADAD